MDIPVYLFTGFLECGKTTFIQGTLEDERFNTGEKTLLLVCEEGEIEYEPQKFSAQSVEIVTVEDESELTEQNLKSWLKSSKAKRVMVEYNGMWQLKSFFNNMPKEWIIYQEMFFAEADTIMNYNANMRSLVVDKLNSCELAVFNRCENDVNREELHKLVRGVSRKADIVFDYKDGRTEYDDIEDPLPFDINADVIEIGEKDFALWYRDLMEDPKKYNNKKLKFLGIAAKDRKMPKLEFAIGRHIMTCCVEDIQYGGIVAQWERAPEINTGDWLTVSGRLILEFNTLYGEKGPVLKVSDVKPAQPPQEKVATFY